MILNIFTQSLWTQSGVPFFGDTYTKMQQHVFSWTWKEKKVDNWLRLFLRHIWASVMRNIIGCIYCAAVRRVGFDGGQISAAAYAWPKQLCILRIPTSSSSGAAGHWSELSTVLLTSWPGHEFPIKLTITIFFSRGLLPHGLLRHNPPPSPLSNYRALFNSCCCCCRHWPNSWWSSCSIPA